MSTSGAAAAGVLVGSGDGGSDLTFTVVPFLESLEATLIEANALSMSPKANSRAPPSDEIMLSSTLWRTFQ